MLRNYTLVADEVDLAGPSNRKGCLKKGGKRRRVVEVMGTGVREEGEGFLASVMSWGSQARWPPFLSFQTYYTYLFII